MTDRTVRFAARIIAVGMLGVAWTLATLTLVIVQQGQDTVSHGALLTTAYLGMIPVALLLVYVILTDFADYSRTRRVTKLEDTTQKLD